MAGLGLGEVERGMRGGGAMMPRGSGAVGGVWAGARGGRRRRRGEAPGVEEEWRLPWQEEGKKEKRWRKKKKEEDRGRNIESDKITKQCGKVWQIINCNEHNDIL